jgi:hypothetical protein
VTFFANAWASDLGDGDSFVLAYSTNDSTYVDMFTIGATSDGGGYQSYSLPGTLSGTVYVRVKDTDHSPGSLSYDTVNVDHMYIRSELQPGDPPAAPSALNATAASATQIDLFWTDDAVDELGFQVERSSGGPDWEVIDSLGADITSYSNTGLTASTAYDYRVRAYNSSGSSDYSNIASATTSQPDNMHVGDLNGASNAVRNKWNGTVTITVHDSGHGPVEGATVSGSWSSGATGSGTCVTSADGTCSITKNNLKSNAGSVTFTVSSLSHGSFAYASGDNHDPDGDSNGTEIIIEKPQ